MAPDREARSGASTTAAWKRRMELQNERRQSTYDLWERLDDLVTDASEFPHDATEPCAPSRPHYAPRAAWPC